MFSNGSSLFIPYQKAGFEAGTYHWGMSGGHGWGILLVMAARTENAENAVWAKALARPVHADYKNPLHLDVADRYLRFMGDKTIPDSAESFCLVHPCVRDKRRVSEIDLSQPRHETAFWWRHNRPVTSQLTDPITLPNYPLELIGIYVHINTQNKESLIQRCRRSTNVQLCLIFLHISIWFDS